MAFMTGALGRVVPKLGELLKEEYKLQTGVRENIMSLSQDLEMMRVALQRVAEVPLNKLDEQAKLRARDVLKLSYKAEDILDTFLVRVESREAADPERLNSVTEKIANLLSKICEANLCRNICVRHQIARMIKTINGEAEKIDIRQARYDADKFGDKQATTSTVDPRLKDWYDEGSLPLGIQKASDDLISMLISSQPDDGVNRKKVVSVVGRGGLGKTTLAKHVYDTIKSDFNCWAFVPVGQNPVLKKVLRDILIDLNSKIYTDSKYNILDERQLIKELQSFLYEKRYFIVIDDVWEIDSWDNIKMAFVENNNGSRIITTTRNHGVATEADHFYELQKLSYDNSKRLFDRRIFGGEGKCPNNQPPEVYHKILKKCDGLPLAIITMASLLEDKSWEEWSAVCDSFPFRDEHNKQQVSDTEWILSLSYYDLPPCLKTCFLYLSAFPEDYIIVKDDLIWMWIAEGFVQTKPGILLFEVGEGYFNHLINKCLIQAVMMSKEDGTQDVTQQDVTQDGTIYGCRVHDMFLDLIRSLSREYEFVTISANDKDTLSGNNAARRLALQDRKLEYSNLKDIHMDGVSSFIASRCDFVNGVPLLSFKFLRVLSLEDRKLFLGFYKESPYHLEHLGQLIYLRYLKLRHTGIRELPKEIGALKLLQTLNIDEIKLAKLPASVGLLKQLFCLRAEKASLLAGIMEKLTSLQELKIKAGDDDTKGNFVKELGNLSEIMVLRIDFTGTFLDKSMQSDLLQSLGKLHKMQHLALHDYTNSLDQASWDAAVLSRHIRHLTVWGLFDTMPSCINASGLPYLSHLTLQVICMDEQGMKMLGGLSNLQYLDFITARTVTISNIAIDGCFQKLRLCRFRSSAVQFVLNEDMNVSFTLWNRIGEDVIPPGFEKKGKSRVSPAVMPNLQKLHFEVRVGNLKRYNGSCDILGLEYLPSLQEVIAVFHCDDAFADDVKNAEESLRHAIEVHPKRPTIQIIFKNKNAMPASREQIQVLGHDDPTKSSGGGSAPSARYRST